MNPTPEQIAKLPKWAKEHLETQERLICALNQKLEGFVAAQPESPFYVEDNWVNPPVRRYVAVPHRTIQIDWAGVHLEVFLPRQDDGQRMYGPEIRFSAIQRTSPCQHPVAIVPRGIETIHIVHKDNL